MPRAFVGETRSPFLLCKWDYLIFRTDANFGISFLKAAYHLGYNSCTRRNGNGALCLKGKVLLAGASAPMPKISDACLCPI